MTKTQLPSDSNSLKFEIELPKITELIFGDNSGGPDTLTEMKEWLTANIGVMGEDWECAFDDLPSILGIASNSFRVKVRERSHAILIMLRWL